MTQLLRAIAAADFARSVASVLELLPPPPAPRRGPEHVGAVADAAALESDWRRVGGDLSRAMSTAASEVPDVRPK